LAFDLAKTYEKKAQKEHKIGKWENKNAGFISLFGAY